MSHYPKPFFRPGRRLWYVQIQGTQINLGPDEAEAFRRYHELMAGRKRSLPRAVSKVTSLVGIIDSFLDWTLQHKAADTHEWYRYRLQRFVERYPDLSVDELRPFHVQEWADSYQLSVTSQRNYLRSVKRCLKWAARQGYIERSPIADLEVPAAESREVVVSQSEFDRLMANVPDAAFRDLLTVTWESGCRPQESLRVEARHVDLQNRRWVFSKSESKKKRLARVVYLTDPAFGVTQQLMLRHPQGPLFRNSAGKAWTTDAVNCAFGRLCIRIGKQLMRERRLTISDDEMRKFATSLATHCTVKGVRRPKTERELLQEAKRKLSNRLASTLVPNYSLYALRHSWATHALQRGVDSLTVAILMGHKDPAMLAKVYQHLSLNPGHLLDQARKAVG